MADDRLIRRLPFTIIENNVIQDENLTKEAVMLYLVLCFHANAEGVCWPSRTTLARETRCSEAGIVNSMRELTTAGFIEKQQRTAESGASMSNLYVLTGKRGRGHTGTWGGPQEYGGGATPVQRTISSEPDSENNGEPAALSAASSPSPALHALRTSEDEEKVLAMIERTKERLGMRRGRGKDAASGEA